MQTHHNASRSVGGQGACRRKQQLGGAANHSTLPALVPPWRRCLCSPPPYPHCAATALSHRVGPAGRRVHASMLLGAQAGHITGGVVAGRWRLGLSAAAALYKQASVAGESVQRGGERRKLHLGARRVALPGRACSCRDGGKGSLSVEQQRARCIRRATPSPLAKCMHACPLTPLLVFHRTTQSAGPAPLWSVL